MARVEGPWLDLLFIVIEGWDASIQIGTMHLYKEPSRTPITRQHTHSPQRRHEAYTGVVFKPSSV